MKNRIIYINTKTSQGIETVDEFDYNTLKDRTYAKEMLKNYRLSDRTSSYYFSQKCTNLWRD